MPTARAMCSPAVGFRWVVGYAPWVVWTMVVPRHRRWLHAVGAEGAPLATLIESLASSATASVPSLSLYARPVRDVVQMESWRISYWTGRQCGSVRKGVCGGPGGTQHPEVLREPPHAARGVQLLPFYRLHHPRLEMSVLHKHLYKCRFRFLAV